jgi:hypothetical protein
MKKIKVEVPVFERVQTGVNLEDRFITSDGKEFASLEQAKDHEAIFVRMNHRTPRYPEVEAILTFHSLNDFLLYEERYLYNYEREGYLFDPESLVYPGTYVLIDYSDYADDDAYPTYLLGCITLDEYKLRVQEMLSKL